MYPKRSMETKNRKRQTKRPTYPIKIIPGMYLIKYVPARTGFLIQSIRI